MPDPNKLAALAAAGFKLLPTCGTCIHWESSATSGWGTCAKIEYVHLKHQAKRLAGVPADGACPSHQARLESVVSARANGYDRFWRQS
jgi:hypothetical protein